MALSVRLPFISRALALPFLTILEPSKKCDDEQKRRHKTTLKWTSQMVLLMRRWIGKTRQVILVGDGGFAAGQLAIDCIRTGVILVTLVVDPTGKLDPLPLMSTDSRLSPEQIIAWYIDRWSIEVTFETVREHLGVETQRQWSDNAIARTTPILMGLYSLVCLMANQSSQEKSLEAKETAWYRKKEVTFSDMLREIRLSIWRENLISRKAKLIPFLENITLEVEEWIENVVKSVLQAA
jgi:transposase